ncbi:Adenylate cyclase 2 [Diplonema papillatum]|nr:Adenylate cyclase 2 [Diplonema papillatum]
MGDNAEGLGEGDARTLRDANWLSGGGAEWASRLGSDETLAMHERAELYFEKWKAEPCGDIVRELVPQQVFSCVPKVLLTQLGEVVGTRSGPPVEPTYVSCRGVILFLDVSGFSKLAADLQQQGGGAELLSFHLNEYFERLLEVVRSTKGDVTEFSGDAMLCGWFSANDRANVHCALNCASDLLEKVGAYEFMISNVRYSMSIHVGVAMGDLIRVVLGGQGNVSSGFWKHLVLGKPVEEAGVAANVAKVNEVAVTEEIVAKVSGWPGFAACKFVVCSENRGYHLFSARSEPAPADEYDEFFENVAGERCRRVSESTASRGQALKFVAAEFTFDTLLLSLSSREIGELRVVSTVFVKMEALSSAFMATATPAEVFKKLKEGFDVVQKQAARFDGVVNKVMMDDKGVLCLCLFGIPQHTHEDDASRAVGFAMKIAAGLKSVIGSVAIGLSRASVFCGMLGSPWRREYTVLGDGVNDAARLMLFASDSIKARAVRRRSKGRKSHESRSASPVDRLASSGAPVQRQTSNPNPPPVSAVVACDPETQRSSNSELYAFSHGGSLALKGKSEKLLVFLCSLKPRGDRNQPYSKILNNSASQSCMSPIMAGSDSCSTLSMDSRGAMSSVSSRSSISFPLLRVGASARPRSGSVTLPSRPSSMSDADNLEALCRGKNSADAGLRVIGAAAPIRAILAWMDRAKEAAARKQREKPGRVLNLVGERGSGKTLLLAKAHELLRERGFEPVAIAGEGDGHYAALKGIVHECSNHPGFTALTTDIDDPEKTPGYYGALHYVTRLPGHPLPDDYMQQLSIEEKAEVINEVIYDVLRKLHRSPLAFLVDDAEALDAASWSFISFVVNKGCHCVMCTLDTHYSLVEPALAAVWGTGSNTSSTDQPGEGSLMLDGSFLTDHSQRVRSADLCVTQVIPPLSESDTADVIRASFNATEVDRELLAVVYLKSAGNPGSIRSMVGTLADQRAIALLPNRCVVVLPGADIEAAIVTALRSHQASVMRLLDSLPRKIRTVARVCAVLGPVFSENILRHCCGSPDLGLIQFSSRDGTLHAAAAPKPGHPLKPGTSTPQPPAAKERGSLEIEKVRVAGADDDDDEDDNSVVEHISSLPCTDEGENGQKPFEETQTSKLLKNVSVALRSHQGDDADRDAAKLSQAGDGGSAAGALPHEKTTSIPTRPTSQSRVMQFSAEGTLMRAAATTASPSSLVGSAIATLASINLIEERPDLSTASQRVFSFRKVVTRDIIYQALLKSERKKIHVVVAAALLNKIELFGAAKVLCDAPSRHVFKAEHYELAIPLLEWEYLQSMARCKFTKAMLTLRDIETCIAHLPEDVREDIFKPQWAVDRSLLALESGNLLDAALVLVDFLEAADLRIPSNFTLMTSSSPLLRKLCCCFVPRVSLPEVIVASIIPLIECYFWDASADSVARMLYFTNALEHSPHRRSPAVARLLLAARVLLSKPNKSAEPSAKSAGQSFLGSVLEATAFFTQARGTVLSFVSNPLAVQRSKFVNIRPNLSGRAESLLKDATATRKADPGPPDPGPPPAGLAGKGKVDDNPSPPACRTASNRYRLRAASTDDSVVTRVGRLDAARPAVIQTVLCQLSLCTLLSGDGADSVGYTAHVSAFADRCNDTRWKLYASALKLVASVKGFEDGQLQSGKLASESEDGKCATASSASEVSLVLRRPPEGKGPWAHWKTCQSLLATRKSNPAAEFDCHLEVLLKGISILCLSKVTTDKSPIISMPQPMSGRSPLAECTVELEKMAAGGSFPEIASRSCITTAGHLFAAEGFALAKEPHMKAANDMLRRCHEAALAFPFLTPRYKFLKKTCCAKP